METFACVRAAVAAGVADARAAFELVLGPPSPDWGFLVLAGIEPLIDSLERLRARVDELDWLDSVGALDAPTRRRLTELRFACDIDAAPEGSVVFPGEAVLTVEGPFWQAQLVGHLIQGALTDATLTATRFARLSLASGGAELVESGAAAAYRLGGSPLLARAAFIGGAHSTTSALAGRRYGVPVSAMQPTVFGMAVGDEDKALRAWLAAGPHGAIVRLDAFRARDFLPKLAAAVKDRVQASGGAWDESRVGVEISGGDRLGLARQVVAEFARAGLSEPPIIVSGDVDERVALELTGHRTPVRGFAVGLGTSAGNPGARPASDVTRYELVAIESAGAWSPRIRMGADVASSSDPGRKLLLRFADANGHPIADVAHMTNERNLRAQGGRFVDRATGLGVRLQGATSAPLRASVMRAGKRATQQEPASVARERAVTGIASLDEGYRRIASPTRYPVGMTTQLAGLKTELLARASGDGPDSR
jgi:nicotinate phosphoribosyltransferase